MISADWQWVRESLRLGHRSETQSVETDTDLDFGVIIMMILSCQSRTTQSQRRVRADWRWLTTRALFFHRVSLASSSPRLTEPRITVIAARLGRRRLRWSSWWFCQISMSGLVSCGWVSVIAARLDLTESSWWLGSAQPDMLTWSGSFFFEKKAPFFRSQKFEIFFFSVEFRCSLSS